MLRDAEDAPAAFTQLAIHFPVAFAVADDLGFPEFAIPLRGPVALGTAMPETAIHKDRQPLLAEGEVWLTHKLQMPPPSGNPLFLEDLDQRPLCALVPLSLDQGHHLGSLLLGEDVRHYSSSASPPMAS